MARPTKLDQVVKIDGTREITAGEHVVARIELGLAQEAAARESNISLRTLQNWRQRGAAARAMQAQGKPIDQRELPYIDFLEDLEAAEARWELRHLQRIDDAATRPQQVKKVTIQKELRPNERGELVMTEVGRTEVIEERPSLWTASAWLLERKIPKRYARRVEIDDGSGEGRTPAERATDLAAAARAYLQGVEDAKRESAIEVPVVDDIATGG